MCWLPLKKISYRGFKIGPLTLCCKLRVECLVDCTSVWYVESVSSTELLSTSDLERNVSFTSLTSSTHFLLFTFITSSRNFCTSFLSREKSLTCFDSLSDWTGDLIIGRGCSRLSISSFRRIISPRNTSSSAAEFIGVGGGGGSTKSILVGLLRLSWLRRFGDWLRRLCGRRWTTVSASVNESF